ncbi:MAG: TFIIB-type zinc ribbon-containing protein, partial [Nitrosarchaeum sp.]|nr:TFIIB-type zinc ribbon-containing protein [Nitrosarchaeum sp.]
MVQKLIANKGEILSCSESIIITDYETGEMFCQNCGRILQEKITDVRKEEGSFTQNQHMPTSLTMHDMGLSTIIGKSNHDFVGKPLGYEMKQSMKRMRVWDSRSQVYTPVDRNLIQAFNELTRLKDKLALSDAVIERA